MSLCLLSRVEPMSRDPSSGRCLPKHAGHSRTGLAAVGEPDHTQADSGTRWAGGPAGMARFLGPELLHGTGPTRTWRSPHRRGGGRVCVPRDA